MDSSRTLRLLLAHPDAATLDRLEAEFLKSSSPECHLTRCSSLQQTLQQAASGQCDAAFVSLNLDAINDTSVFTKIQSANPDLPVILLDIPSHLSAVELMLLGAQDDLSTLDQTTDRLIKAAQYGIIRQARRTKSTQQTDLLQNLLEKTPDRIYFKDLESRFLKVSHAMSTLFGLKDPQELYGHSDFDIFTEEHARPAFEDEQHLISGKIPLINQIEKETFPDGRIGWALTSKMPLRAKDGTIKGTFGISHDVTELHEMEAALEEERNQLKVASEALQEKNSLMESDMALAKEIQLALLPTSYPLFPEDAEESESLLRFKHRYIPAQAVGGDFFTVFPITKTKAGVLICDVMGHGPRAAMVTAIVRALREELKSTALYPELFLSGLNSGLQSILQRVEDPMLCTGIYLVVDSESGEVEFASAGHPGPVHLCRKKKKATPIQEYDSRHGPVLGLYDEVSYPKCRFSLGHGDVLLLFTDGIFEVPCQDDEDYGYERLVAQIEHNATLSTEQLLDATLADVQTQASNGFDDDVCLVAVERAAHQ